MTGDCDGSDNTERKQRGLVPFKPGQSGNPSGRPKGSRNRLGEEFLAAVLEDFEQHGADAIERVRKEDPSAYVRVIASILPKEVKVSTESDLTDEQLAQRIQQLADALDLRILQPGEDDEAPGLH